MDSLVSTLVGMLFGSIGAAIIWAFKRGTISYKKILYEQTTLSDVVGIIFVIVLGTLIYFIKV